jgi:hypothetical protein
MNNKTNTWATVVLNPTLSEAIQRIAFSFGYNWPLSGKLEPKYTDATVLYFNPNDKSLTYGFSTDGLQTEVCKVCNTLEGVIELLNNPPTINKVGPLKLFKDGSALALQGTNSVVISKDDFDKAVVVRNELLGQKEKNKKRSLPIVTFKYDSISITEKRRKREILLLKDDVEYYYGLDVKDNFSFKKFRKDRISGNVTFVGMSEEKEW